MGAGCALGAAEEELFLDVLNGFEVHQEILGPLGGSLANGDELGGLQVGVRKGGLVLPLQGKLGEVIDDLGKLGEKQVHGITHQDELCVISNIATCCLPRY